MLTKYCCLAPGPPEQIKALVMTSESIMVAWTRPSEPNGIIVKYNIYISTTQQHGNKVHKFILISYLLY